MQRPTPPTFVETLRAAFSLAVFAGVAWLVYSCATTATPPRRGVGTGGDSKRIVLGDPGELRDVWVDDAAYEAARQELAKPKPDEAKLTRLRACSAQAGAVVAPMQGPSSGIGVDVISGAANGCVGIMSPNDLVEQREALP